jgi:hypothetical protein
MKRNRPGALRGVLLQAGAMSVVTGITLVCLPLVWAQRAVSEQQPARAADETDLLD